MSALVGWTKAQRHSGWTRDDPYGSDVRSPPFTSMLPSRFPIVVVHGRLCGDLGRARRSMGERVSTGLRCESHLPVRSHCLEADAYGWSHGAGKDEQTGLTRPWWVQMTDWLNLNGGVLGL